jgi:hypothetical protein
MSQRDSNLVWLKDMIEHLGHCQQQLLWSDDSETTRLVTESMLRDLECCRRLCETLGRQAQLEYAR